jgi:hypothetical protein
VTGAAPDSAELDRARRLSDQVTLHILAHTTGADMVPDWNGPQPWIAARLSDGSTDGILYPTKAEAIRHQLHEKQCAYLTIPLDGMTVEQARVYLKYTQQMYDNGLNLADPEMQVHLPLRAETNADTIRGIARL